MFSIFSGEGMEPFYQNIGSFPTVVFTFFLIICLLYWLITLLGFVDIDILDFDIPETDMDLSNSTDNLSFIEALGGLMVRLGLNGVPITIILSLITLFSWIICYYAVHFLFAIIPFDWLDLVAGVPVLLGSAYCAVLITSKVIKPLRPLFRSTATEGKKYLLGQTAIVRTSRVDSSFGEATLEDGGAGLILKVRANGDENFKQGDKVVLLEHNAEEGTYRVISEAEFKNG